MGRTTSIQRRCQRGYHPWYVAHSSNKAKRTSLGQSSTFKGAKKIKKGKEKEKWIASGVLRSKHGQLLTNLIRICQPPHLYFWVSSDQCSFWKDFECAPLKRRNLPHSPTETNLNMFNSVCIPFGYRLPPAPSSSVTFLLPLFLGIPVVACLSLDNYFWMACFPLFLSCTLSA